MYSMEIVTVKFQEDILKKVDFCISKHNFNSRTEFIREAVRDKLENLTKQELINKFLKLNGKSKTKTTVEQNIKTKEAVSKELLEELEKRFN